MSGKAEFYKFVCKHWKLWLRSYRRLEKTWSTVNFGKDFLLGSFFQAVRKQQSLTDFAACYAEDSQY